MSFPKAKYTRFNEKPLGCGPDATYNVVNKQKIINAGIVLESKIPRFPNILAGGPPGNTGDSETSSVRSVQSAVCFRTPQPVRRPITRTPSTSKLLRTRSHDIPKIDNASHQEILEAKLVEIRNKDETITEYEHQIEELTNKIRELQERLIDSSKEYDELLIKHKLESEKLKDVIQADYDLQVSDLNKRIAAYEKEALEMREKISNLENELTEKESEVLKLQKRNLDAQKIIEEKKNVEKNLQKTNLEFEELKSKFYSEKSELNEEIKYLTEQNKKKTDNYENLMKQSEDDMLNYVAEYQKSSKVIKDLQRDNLELKNQLQYKQRLIISLQSELSEQLLELDTQKHELSKDIAEQIEALQDEHLNELRRKDDSIAKYQKDLIKVKSELTQQMDLIKEVHDMKIKEMESIREVEKMNIVKEYSDKMAEMENNLKRELSHVQESAEEKLKLAEILSEDKCRQIEISYQNKLENEKAVWQSVLDKCQKIAETEVVQSELEKIDLQGVVNATENKLQEAIKEKSFLKDSLDAYLLEISELKASLANSVKNHNEQKSKLENDMKELSLECEKISSEKFKYELTLSTTRSTVAILSERLKHSDKDVETLKEELDYVTKKKLDLENDNITLKTKCENLNQILDSKNNSLKNLSESSSKLLKLNERMQVDNDHILQEMSELEGKTEQKIDVVRQDLIGKCNALVKQNNTNKELLKDTKGQLEHTLEALRAATEFAYQLTSKNNENEIKELKSEIGQLNAIVKMKDKEVASYKEEIELNKLEYESKNETLNEKMLCFELKYVQSTADICSLKKQVIALESVIESLRKQLEDLDEEKQAIEIEKNGAVDECQKTALKYAELMGHQNNKQKIKHINMLKTEKLELKQEVINLEQVIEKQKRTIESLKKSSSMKSPVPSTARKNLLTPIPRGKENLSPANSPIRSSPALRDRNM